MSASAKLDAWHYQSYKQKWRPRSYGWEALSDRERMIVLMMVSPMSMVKISEELKISVKTANTYRYRAMMKLQVKDTLTLAYLLLNRGKIQNPFASEPNG